MKDHARILAACGVFGLSALGAVAALDCGKTSPSIDSGPAPELPSGPAFQKRVASAEEAAACRGPRGDWLCTHLSAPAIFALGASANFTPTSWSTKDIYWDPANSSAVADDGNSCTTSGAPCTTISNWLNNRWGTRCPFLQQSPVTIHVMSGQTSAQATNDMLTLCPHLLGITTDSGTNKAAFVYIVGTPTVAATTTISALTAKNRSTGIELQVTLTAAVGGVNKLYANTTHPSNAWSHAGTAGGSNKMDQPIFCGGTPTIASLNCGEVNTWSTTDTVQILTLPKIGIGSMLPQVEFMGFTEGAGIYISGIDAFQYGGEDIGDTPMYIGDHVSVQDTSFEKNVALVGTAVFNGGSTFFGIANGHMLGAIQGGQTGTQFQGAGSLVRGFALIGGDTTFAGPGSENSYLHDAVIDDDFVLVAGNMSVAGNMFIGTMENEGFLFNQGGVIDLQAGGINGTTSLIWSNSGGTLDSARGTVFYNAGATGGATTFPGAGGHINGLQVAGGNLACLTNLGAIVTTLLCNLSIASGANLDTNLGALSGCLGAGMLGYCNTPF